MIYEDTYKEWKEDDIEILNERQPKSGSQVQDIILYGTDERRISKRQRCIMIMSAISYEVDHDMLTPELKDELYFYNEDMETGKLEKCLGDNEKEDVYNDIRKYYKIVYGEE